MKKSKGLMVGIGITGFFIGGYLGGYLGFLARPSAMLVGQLPFDMVITRGTNLQGFEQILLPLAQQSFSTMFNGGVVGGVLGAVVGLMIGFFLGKRKTTF